MMTVLTYLMAISATLVVVLGLYAYRESQGDPFRPSKLDLWYHGLLGAVLWMTILFPDGGTAIRVLMVAMVIAGFVLKGVDIARTRKGRDDGV